jgi:adenylate cyclase
MVISRTSAMKLKGRADDIRTMAAKIGVDLVLDGSVRKGRNSLRINAQLVDAAIDAPIWADKFTATDDDLFEVQERLSREIIEAMQITLTRAEADLVAMRPIADVAVYDLYLRAGQKLMRFDASDLDDGVALLRRGLDALPGNELLLARLGHMYLMYVHWAVRPEPRYLDLARECAEQILSARPGSTHGHGLLGGLAIKRAESQAAVRHLKDALRADPMNLAAATWLAYVYMTSGQAPSARPLIERLVTLDPLTSLNHMFTGWLAVVDGRPEDAMPHYRRAYELDPRAPLMNLMWGMALARIRRTDDAIAHFAHVAQVAGSTVFGELAAAFRHALSGDREAARRAIGPATIAGGRREEAVARFLAQFHALNGDVDDACAWLEHAVAGGNVDYPGMLKDVAYEPLRSTPRFQNLLADVKRRWETFEP